MATVSITNSSINLYPFTAIVGQETLKLSLLLNVIAPNIGGVLIYGERGTAKSTAVRSLADILPNIEVVKGCPFSLAPDEVGEICQACNICEDKREVIQRPVRVLTLPLNASEDMVIGGIDFEKTIEKGIRIISPGLLARVHQGILYIDEVNLLDDCLVNTILSVSASRINTVEREGVSFSHPSRFILVGTMNPEEGNLRPQLLDRFGLCVEVKAEESPELRVKTMMYREAFDMDPAGFIQKYKADTEALKQRICQAKKLLPKVVVSGKIRVLIAELCIEAKVAGHRAELVMEQAARALAAFSAKDEVEEDDVIKISPMVLRHRQRKMPHPHKEKEQQDNHNRKSDSSENQKKQGPKEEKTRTHSHNNTSKNNSNHTERSSPHAHGKSNNPDSYVNPNVLEKVFEVGSTFKVKNIAAPKDRIFRRGSGRRSRSKVNGLQGRYVKSSLLRGRKDVALDATLRAAAPYQRYRYADHCAIVIEPQDIREKIRERKIGNFLLFVVDASGSMGSRGRMVATKGAIMSLLLDAYQKRDKVAMISFNKTEAKVLLPPTSSVEMAARLLTKLPVGGRTPLNAALVKTGEMLATQLIRDPTSRIIVILITDGRCNVPLTTKSSPVDECIEIARSLTRRYKQVRFIVVDTEKQGLLRFGLAKQIAEALNGFYFQTEDLKADTLTELVRNNYSQEAV